MLLELNIQPQESRSYCCCYLNGNIIPVLYGRERSITRAQKSTTNFALGNTLVSLEAFNY